MSHAGEILQAAQSRGLELRVVDNGASIEYSPAEAADDRLVDEMRRHKPELITMLLILEALEYGPMKRHELMRETGLDTGIYPALGALYDAGMVKTDPESWYYLPPQYTRPTRTEDLCPGELKANGRRVLACSTCDQRIN